METSKSHHCNNVDFATAASKYTHDTISTKRSCHSKPCPFSLSVSPLNKKDHLTDGKIFLDCFIKRPHKINKTKFEIKRKEKYRSSSVWKRPRNGGKQNQMECCWGNLVGIPQQADPRRRQVETEEEED